MPERYRVTFDSNAIQEHAAIVERRARLLVHVEIWRHLLDGGAVLCVVADDFPGLLSFVSASLVVHDIDITAAKAYTRTNLETGRAEAVDFFWVRRQATPAPRFEQSDVSRVESVLTALISGKMTVQSILRKDRLPLPALPDTPARITFEAPAKDGPDVLTVEAGDRPGLLLTITQALYRARVQIVASDVATRGGRVVDRFMIVEPDGTPLGVSRRQAVQRDVISAVQSLMGVSPKKKSTSPPKARNSPRRS